MRTSNTSLPLNSSLRHMVRILGDGQQYGQVNLPQPNWNDETIVGEMITLLKHDPDPNRRIGVCRLVQMNAGILAQAASVDLLAKALQIVALCDHVANDYAYGIRQSDDDEVVLVSAEAQVALESLRRAYLVNSTTREPELATLAQ